MAYGWYKYRGAFPEVVAPPMLWGLGSHSPGLHFFCCLERLSIFISPPPMGGRRWGRRTWSPPKCRPHLCFQILPWPSSEVPLQKPWSPQPTSLRASSLQATSFFTFRSDVNTSNGKADMTWTPKKRLLLCKIFILPWSTGRHTGVYRHLLCSTGVCRVAAGVYRAATGVYHVHPGSAVLAQCPRGGDGDRRPSIVEAISSR